MDSAIDIKPFVTKHWHTLPNGRIQCGVCPRACKLKEDQRGFCFVRKRENNKIILTTYGRSSGFCIDPVEKKPLNHFFPGTPVLSFGTAGCNLACKFCQNWDISTSRQIDTLANYATPEKIARVAQKYGCKSIAFTYNEPTIFMDYAIDVARACHPLGIKTIAVTNGYIREKAREEFYQYMDAANVDLKAFTSQFYEKLTSGLLQPVLDMLIYLKHHTSVWFEITTLLIPDANDSPAEIEKLCAWIVSNVGIDVPLHFTAFHPDYKMMDRPATPFETLKRARDIALNHGIRYVYTGNVPDIESSTTYCHKCKNKIIERAGYVITQYHLSDDGICQFCQTPCAGVFEGPVSTWGAKRLPIYMDNEE